MASKGKAKYFSESAHKGAQRGGKDAAPPAKRTPEASGLTEDEVNEIKSAYDLFDNDGSGTIAPAEVSAALASLGSDHSASFFRLLDGISELGAEITFEQFLNHVVTRLGNRNSRDGIQHIFELFDHDGSGAISVDKMKRVAKELGESMSAEELEAAIQRVAQGKSEISMDDFYAVMTKKVYK